jgi:hypothetical protein
MSLQHLLLVVLIGLSFRVAQSPRSSGSGCLYVWSSVSPEFYSVGTLPTNVPDQLAWSTWTCMIVFPSTRLLKVEPIQFFSFSISYQSLRTTSWLLRRMSFWLLLEITSVHKLAEPSYRRGRQKGRKHKGRVMVSRYQLWSFYTHKVPDLNVASDFATQSMGASTLSLSFLQDSGFV